MGFAPLTPPGVATVDAPSVSSLKVYLERSASVPLKDWPSAIALYTSMPVVAMECPSGLEDVLRDE
eukprot:4882072-Lingulodinium_polyedra.AAC.1